MNNTFYAHSNMNSNFKFRFPDGFKFSHTSFKWTSHEQFKWTSILSLIPREGSTCQFVALQTFSLLSLSRTQIAFKGSEGVSL